MDDEEEFTVFEITSGERTARKLTYAFNILLFIVGSFIFAVCIFINFDKDVGDYLGALAYKSYYDASIALIIGSMILMASTFAACLSTYFWNLPLLIMYAVMTSISLALNITGSVLTLIHGMESSQAYPFVRDTFQELMWRYSYDMEARLIIDTIQEKIGCCGAASTSDWEYIHMPIPNTCRNQVTGNQFSNSCSEEVSRTLETYTALLSGMGLCSCLMQLFALVLAYIHFSGIMRRRKAIRDDEFMDE